MTATSSVICTPRSLAPLARDMVVSTGLVWPSWGIQAAPTRSSVRTSGQRSRNSSKSISRISTPTVRAIDRPRMISSQRSGSEATEMDPTAR